MAHNELHETQQRNRTQSSVAAIREQRQRAVSNLDV